jgi:hypothetical protein
MEKEKDRSTWPVFLFFPVTALSRSPKRREVNNFIPPKDRLFLATPGIG